MNQVAAGQFLKQLDHLEYGSLELLTPDGKKRIFEGKNPGSKARLEMRDWRVIGSLLKRGDTGFAEDYQAGLWDTDNLPDLIAIGLKNDRVMRRFVFGSRFFQTLSRLSYLLKLNTIRGSRKNIHAHYDLGNDFYSLWLDPTMTYSSALFKENEDLAIAQNYKYDRILSRLGRLDGEVLEIGCGWGGFAERVLIQTDMTVKGLTLSTEQQAFASDRLADHGKRSAIVLEDYRHQSQKFDSIVSIEMFEAVGEKYWPTYFKKLVEALKENGKAVIQTITIDESRFDRYRKGGDVIRNTIFPGGMLPSPSRFKEEAAKAGLKINDEFHFGADYARTLQHWLSNFDSRRESVKSLGYDDTFIRLWRFYLAACIAGFATGRTSVMQVELAHA